MNYKLQIINSFLILIFFFIIYHLSFIIPAAYAADSTPSADIKSKLEELKKEIASKAAKLKGEVDKRLKNRAYVGKIKIKSDTNLTLAASSGPKIISTNQDTVFESMVKNKKFTQKLIAEEDYIAALGDMDETGVLTAKKVVLLPTTNSEPKTYLWGQIISDSEKLLTLKGKDGKNIAILPPTSVNININDFVILVGKLGKNEIFEAGFVYIYPQGILKPKKTASPSATPKLR